MNLATLKFLSLACLANDFTVYKMFLVCK